MHSAFTAKLPEWDNCPVRIWDTGSGSLDIFVCLNWHTHYSDILMSAVESQITVVSIVYSTVFSGADQRKYQSSASLAFVRGIHRWPMNSPHEGPVTWKMFPFDDVIIKMTILHRQPNFNKGTTSLVFVTNIYDIGFPPLGLEYII